MPLVNRENEKENEMRKSIHQLGIEKDRAWKAYISLVHTYQDINPDEIRAACAAEHDAYIVAHEAYHCAIEEARNA
jgi:hypothetical protein